MGKTSKERMRKLQERRRNDASFDIENHREKERKRIANLRKNQKVQRSQDQELMKMQGFHLYYKVHCCRFVYT